MCAACCICLHHLSCKTHRFSSYQNYHELPTIEIILKLCLCCGILLIVSPLLCVCNLWRNMHKGWQAEQFSHAAWQGSRAGKLEDRSDQGQPRWCQWGKIVEEDVWCFRLERERFVASAWPTSTHERLKVGKLIMVKCVWSIRVLRFHHEAAAFGTSGV